MADSQLGLALMQGVTLRHEIRHPCCQFLNQGQCGLNFRRANLRQVALGVSQLRAEICFSFSHGVSP